MMSKIASRLRSGARLLGRTVRQSLHLYDSEHSMATQSQEFWSKVSTPAQEAGQAHWRGRGIFADDDSRWLALGENNFRIFRRMAGDLRSSPSIVDWGCGGGSNAVHFGRDAAHYYGVDITQDSLTECARQMKQQGLGVFQPVLIEVSQPERALELIPHACDLILSTYVFELIPTKGYGERVLRIMRQLLKPGGLTFVQIKYADRTRSSRARPWDYRENFVDVTTYYVEEFWAVAKQCGLTPEQVLLEPEQPLVDDRRYAYFLLSRGT